MASYWNNRFRVNDNVIRMTLSFALIVLNIAAVLQHFFVEILWRSHIRHMFYIWYRYSIYIYVYDCKFSWYLLSIFISQIRLISHVISFDPSSSFIHSLTILDSHTYNPSFGSLTLAFTFHLHSLPLFLRTYIPSYLPIFVISFVITSTFCTIKHLCKTFSSSTIWWIFQSEHCFSYRYLTWGKCHECRDIYSPIFYPTVPLEIKLRVTWSFASTGKCTKIWDTYLGSGIPKQVINE